MNTLRIVNPDLSRSEKTFLSADYSSGTILTVENNFGYANDDIAVVGDPGVENTEAKDVTSQTGNTIINISAALKFSHNKSDTVYRYEYDQFEISRYRSATWTVISFSTIQWDKRETLYIDDDGLTTDSYRYRLYNSASATASDYSPTIPATGFTRNQVGYMVNEVRKILQDINRRIIPDDAEIIRQFNKAQDIIKAIRRDWWFLRKESAGQITTLINTRKYGLNTYLSDLNQIDIVRFRYNDGSTDNTYPLKVISLSEMDELIQDGNQATDDWPRYATLNPPDSSDDTGYITIDRKIKTTGYGSFHIRYFKKMTDLSGSGDETDVPIPSILEDFALAYAFRIKGDEKRAAMYEESFYGPPPGRADQFKRPTGIRLLEIMQSNKSKAVGQPEVLKKWRGRNYNNRHYGRYGLSPDTIRENYF